MATGGRTMPGWAQAAAVRQALRTPRDWIGGLGGVLWRRKLLILACVGLVLGSTAVYVRTLTPAYEAEALVAPDEQIGPNGATEDPLRLIQSRAMAQKLVERLDLQLLPEFHPDQPSPAWRQIALTAAARWLPAALIDRLPKEWADTLATRASERPMTDEERAARLREAVIEATMARTRAEVADASALGLKFISEDPQIAAAGANALADLYLEQRPARRQNASQGERAELDHEIESLRADIRATEQAIAAQRHDTDVQASGTREQSRPDLTAELAFWRRERAEIEGQVRQVQAALDSGADLAQIAPALNSERLGQLQSRAIELRQSLAALSQQNGEQDPQILDLRAELAALEQNRRAELEQILKELRDETGIIQSRERALEEKIRPLGDGSTASPVAGDLTALEQKLEADRALLRERLEQAATRGEARIIRPAVVPEQPTYPRLALIWAVAVAGALALGLASAFVLEAVQGARP